MHEPDNSPLSFSSFADAIDSHVHLGSHRVMDDLLELSQAAGLRRLNIVCVPGSPERSLNCNAVAMLAKARHPERVFVFGGLHYDAGLETTAKNLLRQAEELHAAGCDGIKMLEGKPSSRKRIPLTMDDPVYNLFYGFLQEAGIPVVSHVGDPASFWDPALISPSARQNGWDYTDGTFPARDALYAEIEAVLARFPRLRLVLAHFLFMSAEHERLEAFMRRWPNVSLDITPGAEMYRNFSKDTPLWRDFFSRHRHRIIFGTDNMAPREPWPPARAGMLDKVGMMRRFLETADTFEGFCTATVREVTGIGLDAAVTAPIYRGNFEKLAGTVPRPLDHDRAAAQASRVADFARRTPGQEPLLADMLEIKRLLEA